MYSIRYNQLTRNNKIVNRKTVNKSCKEATENALQIVRYYRLVYRN